MIWEDSILERKTESDLKDILKTLVGFANSVFPGHKATLLIGEKDDGTIQGVENPDNIQKRVRAECDKIYPSILYAMTVYEKENKSCVRVDVEHNGQGPHFGGPSWIRKGSETIKASDEQFQLLVDVKSSLVKEITKWVDKEITIQQSQPIPIGHSARWSTGEGTVRIKFVNNFWVTFQMPDSSLVSEPLKKLTLSYDDKKYRLKVFIDY